MSIINNTINTKNDKKYVIPTIDKLKILKRKFNLLELFQNDQDDQTSNTNNNNNEKQGNTEKNDTTNKNLNNTVEKENNEKENEDNNNPNIVKYDNWKLYKNFYPDTDNSLYNTVLDEVYPTLKNNYFNPINAKQRISVLFIDPVLGKKIKDGTINNISAQYNYARLPQLDWSVSTIVSKLKQLIEEKFNETFDYCLFHLYLSGDGTIAWHHDQEALSSIIASYSLGDTRSMHFRKRGTTKAEYKIELNAGDLLIMDEQCQHKWEHTIAKQAKKGPRENFTFRKITTNNNNNNNNNAKRLKIT